MNYPEAHTKYSIIGGTFFSALPSIGTEDFLTTGVMAIFGALVSYFASLAIKYVHRYIKNKRP
ncbi:hypothetical protein NO995_00730 [Aestuariibaculum sp. M13]|uniref:hypothetical protein n=1 Tax=Aestuariibaculum sp. M13 TaxID=2967132 RepID=UPI002159C621|nr:hypothetical protein [Aestuariibaculum sp. M13]MCR8666195.1 hypothetical protein [Aestuariibaculum sp. M13]